MGQPQVTPQFILAGQALAGQTLAGQALASGALAGSALTNQTLVGSQPAAGKSILVFEFETA